MKKKHLKEINGALTLCIEDQPLQCAIIPPLMVPGRLAGTAEFQVRPCGEMCPLFKIDVRENDLYNVGTCCTIHFGIAIKNNLNPPFSSTIALNT